jgi:hypothetical protein
MKAYWGSGNIAPRIPNLDTRMRGVVSFTPQPLYPQGKSPWYPLDRRLGGPPVGLVSYVNLRSSYPGLNILATAFVSFLYGRNYEMA